MNPNEKDWLTARIKFSNEKLEQESFDGIDDIVKEVMRRGEVKAWEAAADLLHEHDPSTGRQTSPVYWGNTLRKAIKAKLASLNNDKTL